MKNRYEVAGDITYIYGLNRGKPMTIIIDTDMLPRAKKFPGGWYPKVNKKTMSVNGVQGVCRVNGSYSQCSTTTLGKWLFAPTEDNKWVLYRSEDRLNCTRANMYLSEKPRTSLYLEDIQEEEQDLAAENKRLQEKIDELEKENVTLLMNMDEMRCRNGV